MAVNAIHIDDVLRARPIVASNQRAVILPRLFLMLVIFGMIYGAVMGSFGGFAGQRTWQALYAAAKVPLMLTATGLLSLSSFFVVNTLLGLRADFSQALRAIIASQAALTIILASLAPFTAFWYLSTHDYHAVVVFNGLMFAVASVATQVYLRRLYRPLIEKSRRHLHLLHAWLVIYIFVGMQMGWILRPFVGVPNSDITFFREQAWDGNAYMKIGKLLWQVLGG